MPRGILDEDDPREARLTDDRQHVAIAGTIKRVDKQAVFFNDGIRNVWVPFSIPEPRLTDPQPGIITLCLPLWWAKKKNLI